MRPGLLVVILICAAVAAWLFLAPPRWWLNLTKSVDLADPVRAGEAVVMRYDCRGCHRVGGMGALKGPDLAGVTGRLDRVSLRLWLLDPRAIDGNTPMPDFRLSDSEIDAIVAYLADLDRTP